MIKNILKKIGNILFYLVLILMVAICINMVAARAKGKQPSILGYKFFVVMTGSMEPVISPGDLVIVKEVDPSKIKENDVITFKVSNGQNIVTHRVKDIKNNNGLEFVTQGDANNTTDANPVKARDVIGEVTSHIDRVGDLCLFINRNILKILSVIIIVVTIWISLKIIFRKNAKKV